MAILVDSDTRLLVQGITGHQGRFHTRAMKEFGTTVVAGVTPGKGGTEVEGVPVYDDVGRAVRSTDANTSIVFVPAPYAMDAVFESIDAGISTIVVITEHIPVHDMMRTVEYAGYRGVNLVGPNCPGIASPGKGKVGILPSKIFQEGRIGVASRSGTLTYEIVDALSATGLGQSTCVGLGGDPVIGTTFVDALQMFEDDEETDAVVLVGEIGGTAEEEAAAYIPKMSKPVAAYIAGQSAPPGKRMGHAGAIISRGRGTAESKIKAFARVGVEVARMPADIPDLVRKVL